MANNKTSAANLTFIKFNNKFSELNSSTERELSEQNFSGITIEKKTETSIIFYTQEKHKLVNLDGMKLLIQVMQNYYNMQMCFEKIM
jgi:hypothetical protein